MTDNEKTIMQKIRQRQAQLPSPTHGQAQARKPEMLYFGCVDARLDPIEDIGIEKGRAVIFRNIGALVPQSGKENDTASASHVSVGAVLELFLTHASAEGKMRHIVVSGHTDCNGLKKACQQDHGEHEHYLPLYLESFGEVRAAVRKKAVANGWDNAQMLREMEKESVRQSVANLMTYPLVRQALEAGTLEVHGWVLDTHTAHILEMDRQTGEFAPM